MRHRYLVAYDICNDKRLRKVHKKVKDYGKPLQYSVYLTTLSQPERITLEAELLELIHQREDRILIVNLGPETNDPLEELYFLGPIPAIERRRGPTVF